MIGIRGILRLLPGDTEGDPYLTSLKKTDQKKKLSSYILLKTDLKKNDHVWDLISEVLSVGGHRPGVRSDLVVGGDVGEGAETWGADGISEWEGVLEDEFVGLLGCEVGAVPRKNKQTSKQTNKQTNKQPDLWCQVHVPRCRVRVPPSPRARWAWSRTSPGLQTPRNTPWEQGARWVGNFEEGILFLR